ncbi:MAG TPA: hypothetical protein DEG17_12635 [Cyanobacteria bacterium UBA11149]|nr:hypothetical protein [Cyanobacteria bacterium UBA11367]HBE60331.1 hypothetical protein [Cyanobacteria bacterium UBA11366]HBK66657.1 hypothetical protein [Cyanobacteria bacterium UBA11166]HBR75427.1 hypothetical protein [Cyanobacteria bacterium UBA11159]HBS71871.1 hypothetical protein [Cyanobacteria bacterium UBA11153]HBW89692.1 hypothetical protein [Cyanobacteria bacterium UBA11149]HCA95153.1 hypothetical protein [Cyanobacteria bacterium UBA9226]
MSLQSDVQSYKSTPILVKASPATAWENLRTYSAPPKPKYQPSTWVKLFNPPTAYSFDEAWLLCECDDNQWLAWIPDYGEILLKTDEFCGLN